MLLRKRSRMSVVLVLLIGALALLAAPLRAQDDPTARDPLSLAKRLLGLKGELNIPLPPPVFKLGDKIVFWVTKQGADQPAQVNAELAAIAPGIYIWVEAGIQYDKAKLSEQAARLDALLGAFMLVDNYSGTISVPPSSAQLEGQDILKLPDVDNDPHFYVLYAKDLRGGRLVIYNPNNSLSIDQTPGNYGNERDMLVVNADAFPKTALHEDNYTNLIVGQFYYILALYNNPTQALWLRDTLGSLMLLRLQRRDISGNDVVPFFNVPNTALVQQGNSDATFGMQQLFLRYLFQRFGAAFLSDLYTQSGPGLTPLDNLLKGRQITDLATGEPITARDVFADFVMANVLDSSIGDGRFKYTAISLGQDQFARYTLLRDDLNGNFADQTVNQFGTHYVLLASQKATKIQVQFTGQPQAVRLPIPGEVSNHFYWSSAGLNRDTTLTREFDLSGVTKATLTFDAWHLMAEHWNYGYVQVSTDNGATWKILEPEGGAANPYGLAYGPGYTGISNPAAPEPFPYLGVTLDTDGITITELRADGPLAQSKDIQPGDKIAGFDGKPWPGQPALIAYLATFKPGDTVKLFIQRGERTFDVSVVLGKHPTRVFIPDPIWVKQRLDLAAYAGKKVLLRFEYVSMPDREDSGFAVDNIAVPEINFSDDAESGIPGWTLNGWQQMANQTPQRFLVQVAQLAPNTPGRVERLIGPANKSTSGSWQYSLPANGIVLLAISGLNDDTDIPARFSLNIQQETTGQTN